MKIIKQQASGRWCSTTANGSSKRIYVYGNTRGEVEAKLKHAMAMKEGVKSE